MATAPLCLQYEKKPFRQANAEAEPYLADYNRQSKEENVPPTQKVEEVKVVIKVEIMILTGEHLHQPGKCCKFLQL